MVSSRAVRPTAAVVISLAGWYAWAHPPEATKLLEGSEAFGDWRDDAPGVRRHIRAQDVPEPGESTQAEAKVVAIPAGASPRLPVGFKAVMLTSGLEQPRVVRTAPNGDIFVSNSRAGEVLVYRLRGDTIAEQGVFAEGLTKPYGMAFYPTGNDPRWVYIANADGVVRFTYSRGDMQARSAPEKIIEGIPVSHHWTRDICFSPRGDMLYYAVGSASNVALDMFPQPREPKGIEAWNRVNPLGATWDTEEHRAMVLSYDPHGGSREIVATGLRNPSGITIQPATGRLWAVINERDGLGDDVPFEYATQLEKGECYGWPWYYTGEHEDPRHKDARPDLRGKISMPDVWIQAHSSPLQIAFYDRDAFPEEYKGSAFVTLHGSWDRGKRTGYKVVRLLFDESGKATGEYEDFMTGFVLSNSEVWGRPVGVTVANDGSLIVSEDGNGSLWRVTHTR